MTTPLDWKAARQWAIDITWLNSDSGNSARCLLATLDLLREADNLLENTEDGPDWYRRCDAWIVRAKATEG